MADRWAEDCGRRASYDLCPGAGTSRLHATRTPEGQVVADTDQQFATKDISEDERMLVAHPELVSHSHYHAFVGGALSDNHILLNIVEVQKKTSRGSRWQKQG